MLKATTLRSLRRWHLYIGLFLAPMILLFAVSGAAQVFRLNEEKGWGGTPPGWLVAIGGIHKNQALPGGAAKRRPPAPAAGGAKPGAHDDHDRDAATPPRHSRLPLQIFALLTALGLFVSTLIGIAIALDSRATRRGSLIAFVLGIAVPVVLLIA